MMNFLHGGDVYSHQIDYDFSANINPLGMPENVRKTLTEHVSEYERYPDVNCTELVNVIAEKEKISAEKIVCGNGAADLIYRIAYALKPENSLIAVPTFSEYEKALRSVGCAVNYYVLSEKNEFEMQEDFTEKICGNGIVFLCNPNNPTGKIVPPILMKKIIEICAKKNCILVIDECFMDFVREKNCYFVRDFLQNMIVLKAFTKIYAMAGLRLGYAICGDTSNAEKIRLCGQSWSVSVPAQIAGMAALNEKNYVEKTVKIISEERDFLSNSLKKFGFTVYASEANFILFKCGFPLDKMLLEKKILIRSCENFYGLGYGFFRAAVRTHNENCALVNAVKEVMKNG